MGQSLKHREEVPLDESMYQFVGRDEFAQFVKPIHWRFVSLFGQHNPFFDQLDEQGNWRRETKIVIGRQVHRGGQVG